MARVMFPVERELARWSSLLLTTHRIIKGDGEETLLVHKINGTRLAFNEQPGYIALAVLSFVGGVLTEDSVRQVNTIAIGCVLCRVRRGVFHNPYYLRGDLWRRSTSFCSGGSCREGGCPALPRCSGARGLHRLPRARARDSGGPAVDAILAAGATASALGDASHELRVRSSESTTLRTPSASAVGMLASASRLSVPARPVGGTGGVVHATAPIPPGAERLDTPGRRWACTCTPRRPSTAATASVRNGTAATCGAPRSPMTPPAHDPDFLTYNPPHDQTAQVR